MADPFASLDLDALVKQATAAPPSTAYVGDTIKRVRDLESQKQAETAPIIDRMKSDFAADRKEVEAKTPAPVDVTAWTQKMPEAHPVEAFGSFGSVFGILASAFVHAPWQTAMTAASSAMNAVRANDIATYKDAYQAWKGNTDLMLKRHDEQYKDFQAAMEKMKTDTAEGNAMLTAMSAKYGDQITEAYKEAGLNGELVKVWEARQRAAQGLLETMPRIEDLNTQVTLVQDLKTAREELAQTQKVGDPSQIEEAQREVQAKEQAVRDYASVKYPSLSTRSNTVAGQQANAIQQGIQEWRDAHDGQEPDSATLAGIIGRVKTAGTAPTIAKERGAAIEEKVAGGMSREEAIRQVDSKSYLSAPALQKIGQNITSVKDGLDAIDDAKAAMGKVFAPTGVLAKYATLPVEKILTTLDVADPNRQMLQGYLARIKNVALREIGQVGGVQLKQQYEDAAKIIDFNAPPRTVLAQLDKLSGIFQHHLSIAEQTMKTGRLDPGLFALDSAPGTPATAPTGNDPLGLR